LELFAIYLMVLALARAVPAALMCRMLVAVATGNALIVVKMGECVVISRAEVETYADAAKRRLAGGTRYQVVCEQDEEEDE
jgi:hypothetical protein